MDLKRKKILHDKYFHGTITEKEKEELYTYFQDAVNILKGFPSKIAEVIITSHPDYGKPDKDGHIRII